MKDFDLSLPAVIAWLRDEAADIDRGFFRRSDCLCPVAQYIKARAGTLIVSVTDEYWWTEFTPVDQPTPRDLAYAIKQFDKLAQSGIVSPAEALAQFEQYAAEYVA